MFCRLRTRCGAVLSALLLFPGVLGAATVVNTNSMGPGSLAQAVSDANMSPPGEGRRIVFSIPGPGVHKIDLSNTPLTLGPHVEIDGYTQPGASPNTLSVGDNAVILIQLDGGGAFAPSSGGLYLNFWGSVIRGLSLTGFTTQSGDHAAIKINTFFADSKTANRIEGNFIGLSPDGVTLNGNDYGIYVNNGQVNVFGGTTPAQRNIISGNRTGIFTFQGAITIIGNYFGTNGTGFGQGYGNDTAITSYHSVIGSAEPGAGNVITGNRIGIQVFFSDSIIRNNLIGPRPDGSQSFGNVTGIKTVSDETLIGGLAPGEGNVIAFNGTGVEVAAGVLSNIQSNSFYGNSFIDIDLGSDGSTPNDVGDEDSGPNNLQNFPIIVSVARNSGETVVSGALNSTAATAFTLQFFANGPSSAPGQRLLGTRTVATNGAGDISFQFAFPIATSTDEFITATATDLNGNTSEFFPPDGAVEFANISTRGNVGTGDNILIGGIILNSGLRTFLIRALGPSLGINGALADPKIEVRASDGAVVGQNDNWRDSQEQQIFATGAAPTNDQEAALLVSLPGQSYTAQVSGVNDGTGIATVEIYALENAFLPVKTLRNISTRGNVGPGDNVLIGGTIVQGSAPQRAVLRAIGPGLAGAGVPNPLQDPTLELHDAEGTLLAANDDWRSDQEQEIIASGLAPQDDRDSAILTTFLPTSYTAIVRGKNGATGIALVEIYKLD